MIKITQPLLFLLLFAFACSNPQEQQSEDTSVTKAESDKGQELLDKYTEVTLTTDLSHLSENQRKMIPLLIEAGNIMNELFWYEAYGRSDSLLSAVNNNNNLNEYIQINYGPWDRLKNNEPFIEGVGPKPDGANFYPADMTKEEFEAADLEDKDGLYTFVRRDDQGNLYTVPYHKQFPQQVEKVSNLLKEAAMLAEDEGLKKYLNKRAEALLTDKYFESDMAWMEMEDNEIDLIIGPIETYEDQLFGYKAAHEAYVLIKDMEWSDRLTKYTAMLGDLQKALPVEAKYKQETPGRESQLGAYDVVYYAGDANAGSKTIAVNLPNDEKVQLEKGTRRLQLKNAMRAKFDEILLPISEVIIDESQRKHITFDAFFANTMFHEVAHGLGIKNTVDGKSTVRQALKDNASAIEEGKADILGIFMVQQLHEKGEIEGDLKDYYTTFMASIFRSVRFGASSAHGKANMVRFNFFKERNAFSRDPETGTYKINYENMEKAIEELSREILVLQGEGDYEGTTKLISEKGIIDEQLQSDLDMLGDEGIPVDIVFNQGVDVLNL